MKRIKTYLIATTLLVCLSASTCEKCMIDPDLIVDLLAPTADIIVGEPVDWQYVVSCVEDNSQECLILNAAASVSKILIDYFIDEAENQGDIVLNNAHDINPLVAGESQSINNTIDVFNNAGIYLVSVNADDSGNVTERNEDNNQDNANVDTRASYDYFSGASSEFISKLKNAAAIVIVGEVSAEMKISSYMGKPVYYAK